MKLNGAMELAPSLGLSRRIVDLVSSGATLKANGLVETATIMEISARLIVNRAAMKMRAAELVPMVERFRAAVAERTPMPLRLDASDAGFAAAFEALVNARREADPDVSDSVRETIVARAGRGRRGACRADRALRRLRSRCPGLVDLGRAVRARPIESLDDAARGARDRGANASPPIMRSSARRDDSWTDQRGRAARLSLGRGRGGGHLCAGRTGSLSSSLLMNAIPAKVAGVDRIAMMSPTPGGALNPAVLAAAHVAGVSEIWRVGGAQAIAALAYGTERIRRRGRDHRARQRLGRGSQAAGLWRGRHRHGGRAVRDRRGRGRRRTITTGSRPTC